MDWTLLQHILFLYPVPAVGHHDTILDSLLIRKHTKLHT